MTRKTILITGATGFVGWHIGPVFHIRNAPTGLSYIGDTTLAQTLDRFRPLVNIVEGNRRVTQAFSNAKR